MVVGADHSRPVWGEPQVRLVARQQFIYKALGIVARQQFIYKALGIVAKI